MFRIVRRSVVFFLAMALVVAGLPLAHAMPCASSAQPAGVHEHHGMADTGASHADHRDMMQASEAPPSQDHQQHAVAPCKCLNCSMCVASFVAPHGLGSTPERIGFAVRYELAARGDLRAFIFIDPGIPIASA
jgi:hypothetical protein